MNKVILMGRLARDPEVRYTQGDKPTAVARYTLAVDRRYKRDNEPDADFITCKAFGKTGEFAEKYLHKGTKIAVVGEIRTGSYDKDGQKVYYTEVNVSEHYFCESKGAGGNSGDEGGMSTASTDGDGFMNVPDDIAEDLPFN